MRRADNLLIVLKHGNLNLLEPSDPLQACNGIAFVNVGLSNQVLIYLFRYLYVRPGRYTSIQVTMSPTSYRCIHVEAHTDIQVTLHALI